MNVLLTVNVYVNGNSVNMREGQWRK